MNLDTIKRNIGKRVGDPDLVKHRGLVEDVFVNAMCDLLQADEYQGEDVPDILVDSTENVQFINYEANFTVPNDTLKFLDVYIPVSTLLGTEITLKKIDYSEAKRIGLEPAFSPTKTECFWYRLGNKVQMILSEDFDVGSQPTNLNFVFSYIKNPDPGEWATANLITDLGYGRDFLYRCINRAAQYLSGGVSNGSAD